MASRYPLFDRSQLTLQSLRDRKHDVHLADVLHIDQKPAVFEHPDLPTVAQAVRDARRRGATVALMMGAHVIKRGLSRYVIDLIRNGWVTLVAGNGACSIHDFELARFGASTESVAKYISQGQFGLWSESGQLNDIVTQGDREGLGCGEAVGRAIADGPAGEDPHRDISIFAAAYAAGVPATVHIGVGYDIIHEHPNFDAAAAGSASYRDFLIYTRQAQNFEGGVVLCFGSAVMGPEIYLKALAMARNVAHRQGKSIRQLTSAVFDLVPLGGNLHAEAPKDSPEYYYRPFKTILVRTVADGGHSYYIRGDHQATLPALHAMLVP